MAIDFKTAEQVANEFLLHLKGLRPEINTAQTDNDFYIKGRTIGGVLAGVYSDIRKISEDAFPQSARREALEKHLYTYFDEGFKQPTKANGPVLIVPSGSTGGVAVVGSVQFRYEPNGNIYTNTEDILIDQASGVVVNVESIGTGQIQNLLEETQLKIEAPPINFPSTVEVFGAPISDGRDVETNEQAAERILDFVRSPIQGGTVSDYEQWAIAADDRVVSATVLRYPYGFGTVGLVIAAGTTDIDTAIENGDPIVVVPSADLLETVRFYIEGDQTKFNPGLRPLTDCLYVFPVIEEPIDVEIKVRYLNGDGNRIPTGESLTQKQLVEREVSRALYKHPPGGFKFGASGYVVASHIEESIDTYLSAQPFSLGSIPILTDRQVEDLAVTGTNRLMLINQMAIPGTITVTEV